jgi:chromosome transmission fidelity protein 18
LATELLPYVTRILSPNVKPVVIQTASTDENGPKNVPMASVRRQEEKDKVDRSVEAMAATGVRFERSRVEGDHTGRGGGWVYRMEPGLDSLVGFETMEGGNVGEIVRYAVRQVLEGEWTRRNKRHAGADAHVVGRDKGRQKGKQAGNGGKGVGGLAHEDVKRDFFGRVVKDLANGKKSLNAGSFGSMNKGSKDGRLWVSYHEGYSNAVRRPITLEELMRGF